MARVGTRCPASCKNKNLTVVGLSYFSFSLTDCPVLFHVIWTNDLLSFHLFQLLPLPTSYPVSPDEGENADLNKFNKRVSKDLLLTSHFSRIDNQILQIYSIVLVGCTMRFATIKFLIKKKDILSLCIVNYFFQTRIRGNLEWAPPRPQIIFNIHPPPK